MRNWIRGTFIVTLALGAAGLPSCSSDDTTGGDASGTGGGSGADAASGGAGGKQPVTCGGTECTLPNGAGIEQLTACCTDDDACGLMFPGASKCMVRDQPGKVDFACDSMTIVGDVVLDGCCGPDGCGALDPFLGCMPNTVLGRSGGTCAYDPNNDCTSLLAVPCDGAEDCGAGGHCCGKFTGRGYAEVGCFASCAALTADAGANAQWLELCHSGDTCETAGTSCKASSYLPPPLARCFAQGASPVADANRDADAVNCGTAVCGAGEQCCIRPPHEPYCAPPGQGCECKPADAAP